jgi:hypothetical protein
VTVSWTVNLPAGDSSPVAVLLETSAGDLVVAAPEGTLATSGGVTLRLPATARAGAYNLRVADVVVTGRVLAPVISVSVASNAVEAGGVLSVHWSTPAPLAAGTLRAELESSSGAGSSAGVLELQFVGTSGDFVFAIPRDYIGDFELIVFFGYTGVEQAIPFVVTPQLSVSLASHVVTAGRAFSVDWFVGFNVNDDVEAVLTRGALTIATSSQRVAGVSGGSFVLSVGYGISAGNASMTVRLLSTGVSRSVNVTIAPALMDLQLTLFAGPAPGSALARGSWWRLSVGGLPDCDGNVVQLSILPPGSALDGTGFAIPVGTPVPACDTAASFGVPSFLAAGGNYTLQAAVVSGPAAARTAPAFLPFSIVDPSNPGGNTGCSGSNYPGPGGSGSSNTGSGGDGSGGVDMSSMPKAPRRPGSTVTLPLALVGAPAQALGRSALAILAALQADVAALLGPEFRVRPADVAIVWDESGPVELGAAGGQPRTLVTLSVLFSAATNGGTQSASAAARRGVGYLTEALASRGGETLARTLGVASGAVGSAVSVAVDVLGNGCDASATAASACAVWVGMSGVSR